MTILHAQWMLEILKKQMGLLLGFLVVGKQVKRISLIPHHQFFVVAGLIAPVIDGWMVDNPNKLRGYQLLFFSSVGYLILGAAVVWLLKKRAHDNTRENKEIINE